MTYLDKGGKRVIYKIVERHKINGKWYTMMEWECDFMLSEEMALKECQKSFKDFDGLCRIVREESNVIGEIPT